MKRVFAGVVALLLLFSLCGCSGDKTYSATCELCNKTYSYDAAHYGNAASHQVKCIKMTNMCKKCYANYCAANGMTPEDY